MALAEMPAANLALISVPGDYAAAEAMKALAARPGRHAVQRQRHASRTSSRSSATRASTTSWSWGPTAARRSSTASRSASPTSCGAATIGARRRLRHRHCRKSPAGSTSSGQGVSQALGTGGHDLTERHRRHLDAARAATRSRPIPATRVIVLVSKPPAAGGRGGGAGRGRGRRQAGRGHLPRRRPRARSQARACTVPRPSRRPPTWPSRSRRRPAPPDADDDLRWRRRSASARSRMAPSSVRARALLRRHVLLRGAAASQRARLGQRLATRRSSRHAALADVGTAGATRSSTWATTSSPAAARTR